MGMTIDEAIPILHDMYNYYNDTDIDAYVGFDKEDNNAIETALETMRKYQQIQDIYLKWNRNYGIQTSSAWTEVIEVIENGNEHI